MEYTQGMLACLCISRLPVSAIGLEGCHIVLLVFDSFSTWKIMKAFPIHHHFGQQLNALLPGPYQFETCGISCSKLAPSDARLCTHRSFGLLTLQVWWVSSARRQTRCKHLEPSNQWMSEWHFESRTPFGWTFASSWHTELTSVLNFSIYTGI